METVKLQCMYCDRVYLTPAEDWDSGKLLNCICNILNGAVCTGRFKVIGRIYNENE